MADLIHWKESQLKKMRQEFDTLFDKLCQDFCPPFLSFSPQPKFEIVNKNEHLIVQAELPGLAKDELEVKISEDALLVRGHQQRQIEWETGGVAGNSTFSSEIRLPCKIDPDQVQAYFKGAVLRIVMKKREASAMKQLDVTMED